MNIGIVTSWFERGAAYVSQQYRRLLTAENNVYIYARGGEAYAKKDAFWHDQEVTCARFAQNHVSTYVNLRDFRSWVDKNQLEVVFFNEQLWWPPVLLANRLGVKTGAYVDYYTEDTVPLFRNYDFLICNTRRHHSVFDWHPQAFYIPWGTDVDVFTCHRKESPPDPVVFFHSAGMNPHRKGTDIVLKAFASLNGDSRLIIHTQKSIDRFVSDKSIEGLFGSGRLKVITETIHAPGLYHLGDVYVYPTRLEGIGLTIAEAYACGLPVIVPDEEPMCEFVCKEQRDISLIPVMRYVARSDGYYWPQCIVSEESLREKMKWFVNNPQQIPRARRQARNHAVRRLNWNSASEALLRCFERSRKLSIDHRLVEKTFEFENRRFPLLLQFPFLYRLLKLLQHR